MLKKIVVYTLLFIFSTVVPLTFAAPAELSLEDKLDAIETTVSGAILAGTLIERADRLEESVYGESYTGSILKRIDLLYAHVLETSETTPSVLTKVNAIEWMIEKKITGSPVQTRVNEIEKTLGSSAEGTSLDDRLDNLSKYTFSGSQIEIVPAILTADSLIKVQTVTPLNSKTAKEGDVIELTVEEDFFIGSVLIIPKGAKAAGKVLKATPAKNFGRDAKLEFSVDSVNCITGAPIQTLIGEKAKKETLSLAKATGASVAGIAILGPVGIIGGVFISGKNIDIQPGAQFYVQVKEDHDLFGVTVK